MSANAKVSQFRAEHGEERHFSPKEIAAIWRVSVSSVIRLFEREPGVIDVNSGLGKHAKRHRTLRIPKSVMERVHRRREVA